MAERITRQLVAEKALVQPEAALRLPHTVDRNFELPAARTAVAAARGTEEGEDAWARAQVAIAGLQASRSRAMIALADIDRLYVDAALEGTALDSLTAAREQIAGQVEQEDAVVEELLGSL